MAIITCNNLSIAFGINQVLDGVDLDIDKGEKLCITGRNGTGKSTLLKLLAGSIEADDGAIWRQPGLKMTTLQQKLPDSGTATVYDFVAAAYQETGELLTQYHQLLVQLESGQFDTAQQTALDRLQRKIDHADGWEFDHKIAAVLDRFGLDANAPLGSLSGGWLRRAAIARSLVDDPDVWLLDEPTNHLDIPTITWLENQLREFAGTLVFISHDRRLMQSVASAIVDIDRGRLRRWDCDYETFLARKAHQLEVEQTHHREFDKHLAAEEAWIRQGIQARRTRNEGRVRALQKLREERKERRVTRALKMEVDAGEQSGRLVWEVSGVTKAWDDKVVIKDLDLIVTRGDRIGLLGPNGAGKSTLLKLLLGKITPDSGTIKTGTRLEIAYFDQVRAQIDPDQTVADAVSDGRDHVTVNGKDVHVMTWLGNFLFTPARARSPVRVLSGGEQNRLLLARLFSQPANLIVMDEPTNDLDIESLELLEELLLEYTGTVVMVTHDRTFLDNVVSSLLVFEGDGVVTEYVGGYSDWVRATGGFDRPETGRSTQKTVTDTSQAAGDYESRKAEKRRQDKLARELEALPGKLEAIEAKIESIHVEMAEPAFYNGELDARRAVEARLQKAEAERDTLYARWEELEALI